MISLSSVSVGLFPSVGSSEESLTSAQLTTSQLIQSFCTQATDSSVLLGMVCGSLFASIAKVHSGRFLNTLFSKNPTQWNQYAIRGGSNLFACMAEATGIHSIPKIIQEREVLGGRVEEGWGGWIHTSLTMILLKGAAPWLPPNLVLQHLAQDALMVQLDEICGEKDLIATPTGTFLERMIHAEVMTCQMMASGALMHCTFFEMKIFEAKEHLKYQVTQSGFGAGKSWFPSSKISELALVEGGKFPLNSSSDLPFNQQDSNISVMAMVPDRPIRPKDSSLLPLFPWRGENSTQYAERLVEVSQKGEIEELKKPQTKRQEGRPSLEIVQVLHRLAQIERGKLFIQEVMEELIVRTQEMEEKDGILVRRYQLGGINNPILIVSTPSTFLPENWSITFAESLVEHFRRFPHSIDLAVELGCGTGFPSIVLNRLGKVGRVLGYDINPYAPVIASFNAFLNGVSNAKFYEGDLLSRLPKGQKADLIIGCLPQIPSRPQLGPKNIYDHSHIPKAEGVFEDILGHGLVARAIEQSRNHLTPLGHLILMMAGRPGMPEILNLFQDRQMHPVPIISKIIPQAAPTGIFKVMAEIESQTGHIFEFLSPEGRVISATEASQMSPEKVHHWLYSIQAEPYRTIAARTIAEIRETPERWGYTEDPVTEDPKLLRVSRELLNRQLKLDVHEETVAIGPNSEAVLEGILRLTVDPHETVGFVGGVDSEVRAKIEKMNGFKFLHFDVIPENAIDFDKLAQEIRSQKPRAVVIRPPRQMLKDSLPIQNFLDTATDCKTRIILLEDHPSRANDPSYTILSLAAQDSKVLRNLVSIQDLKEWGIGLPISLSIIPDSSLYTALLNYGDVTYSRVATPSQRIAERFLAQLLEVPPLDREPIRGEIRRVEADQTTLSRVARGFQISEVFGSSPTTKPKHHGSYIDMSFGESEKILLGNHELIVDSTQLNYQKELRKTAWAVTHYFSQTRGAGFKADEVLLGLGVHPLLHTTILGLSQLHGEIEVLIPEPRYGAYYPTILTAGKATLVRVPTSSQNRFLMTLDDLRAVPKRKGVKRVLIDNFPTNPAGQYYESLGHLVQLAREVDYFLVDEVFGLLDFMNGHDFRSLASIDTAKRSLRNRLVFYGGLSKEFALGGVRFGFALTHNAELLQAMRENLITEPDPLAMKAAQYFLPRWKDLIPKHIDYLKPKARMLTQFFCRRGFGIHQPEGGYALFVNLNRLFEIPHFVKGEKITRNNFHELLMQGAGVKIKSDQWAGVKGHYRFVFSIDNLPEAIQRLEVFFDQTIKRTSV